MVENNNKQIVNVLWTGGYDSTYRMVELSRKNVIIQPYYLSDKRKSELNELNAIAEITKDIKLHPETKCTIRPLVISNVSDVKPDAEVTKSYQKLRKFVPIGSQYDWLARFAKENELEGLELGIEKAVSSQVVTIFKKVKSKLNLVTDGEISYYELDKSESDPDLLNIFGRFHYPNPLYNMTKLDLLNEFKKLGYEDTMIKTWFCHHPIRNKPCGVCSPCKSTLSEGMDFRFPKSSLVRNKFSKLYNTRGVGRVLRKLKI